MSRPEPKASEPMKPASSAAPIAASSRRIASVASARTAMMASSAPIAKAAMARALDDGERVVLEQVAVRAGRRVRAVAVGDDVPPRRLGRGRGPPLVRGREAGSAAAAQAGRRRSRRSSRSARGRGSPRAARRTRRRASRRRGRSDRPAPARSSRIVGQPAGVLSTVAMVTPARRPRPASPPRARPEGGEVGRLGRSARRHRGGLAGRLGGLEAQVAVVRRRAVDHRVPRAGPLADALERGDRQVAVGGLGRLEDREHARRVVVVAPRGSRRRPRGRPRRTAGRPGRARAGRSGAGRIPRAARRTSRARPSGRGSGRACPCRPCRCTRSGRPARTGSRSRT